MRNFLKEAESDRYAVKISYNGNKGKEYLVEFPDDCVKVPVIAMGFESLVDFLETRKYEISLVMNGKNNRLSDSEKNTLEATVNMHNILSMAINQAREKKEESYFEVM
jgi:hypothetical protein